MTRYEQGFMRKLAELGVREDELSPDEFKKLRRVWGMPEEMDDTAEKRRHSVKRNLTALITGLNAASGALAGGVIAPTLYNGKFSTSAGGSAGGGALGALVGYILASRARKTENRKARMEIASGKRLPEHIGV